MLLTKQPIWEAVFACRFFPTCSNLVRKLKPLRKRVTSATTCISRTVKSSSSQAGISIRRWPLGTRNIPVASVRETASREPKLTSVRTQDLKKEGNASFSATPRSPKFDIGSYVYHARENLWKKRDYAENFIVSPRKMLHSCKDSFWLAAIWSVSPGA